MCAAAERRFKPGAGPTGNDARKSAAPRARSRTLAECCNPKRLLRPKRDPDKSGGARVFLQGPVASLRCERPTVGGSATLPLRCHFPVSGPDGLKLLVLLHSRLSRNAEAWRWNCPHQSDQSHESTNCISCRLLISAQHFLLNLICNGAEICGKPVELGALSPSVARSRFQRALRASLRTELRPPQAGQSQPLGCGSTI
jgi:hypothetical protein